MKKVLCFMLILLLVFDTTFSYTIYAIGFQPSQEEVEKFKQDALATGMWYEGDDGYLYPKDTAADKLRKFVEHGITVPKLVGQGTIELAEVLSSFFGNADNYQKNVKTDGQYVYFDNDFTNNINIALQDKVHAMDGFWLVEPTSQYSPSYRRIKYNMPDEQYNAFLNGISGYTTLVGNGASCDVLDSNYYVYADTYTYSYKDYYSLYLYSVKDNKGRYKNRYLSWSSSNKTYAFTNSTSSFLYPSSDYENSFTALASYIATLSRKSYGQPFKVFYSYDSLINYLTNNQQRTYVPKLPSGGFKVNIKYINNTTNLPDITYNITTENKTETEIQNQYNTTINNYLNGLDDFTDGGGGNNPTPTPIISDGEPTPTPTPDWGDGSLTPTPVPGPDMTETNDWLKKIYELLEKFYNAYKEFTNKLSDYLDNNDAFFKKVSEYLEKYDGKLDQIIDALDKIAQGKDEGDEKGCQYDYKELSEFLTKLWNDSDKKFDDMIDLLEENNEYQEKMLSTLNSIKNILRAQSVMDTFKNRSKETANKAKEKFPTSVPWDIAMIVNAMDAEPEDPVFLLPIKIERLGIDEEIKVDLSTGEWEKLAKACRYMLTVLFILFMIKLSMKLFSGKDDD